MEELTELRERIENQDYHAALKIIDELEEMSKEDKLNKIHSYLVTTDRINRINKRLKAGGYYADRQTLQALIAEAYPEALREASYEAFEGAFSPEKIESKIDMEEIFVITAMRLNP